MNLLLFVLLSVVFCWDQQDADWFIVEQSIDGGNTFEVVAGTEENMVVLQELEEGKEYQFRVTAVKNFQQSDFSESIGWLEPEHEKSVSPRRRWLSPINANNEPSTYPPDAR